MQNKKWICLLCALCVSVVQSTLAQTTRPAPSFMIGVWYQPASSLPRWKSLGINTAVGVQLEPNVTAADYVNWAHAQGLYVVGKAAEADAWEQVDEPDGAGAVDPEMILFQYSKWKALPGGAQRPVFLSLDGWRTQFGTPEEYKRYCQGADWISFDYYVINRGEGPDAIKKLGERIDQLKAWAPGKRVIAFIEVSDQNLRISDFGLDTKWGPALAPKMRGPTADEVEKEVQVCLAHGASGVVYFPQKIGKQWEAFDVMTAEVAARIAVLNAKLAGGTSGPVGPAATQPTTQPATQPIVTPPVVVTPPVTPLLQVAVPSPTLLQLRTRILVDANLPPTEFWFTGSSGKDPPRLIRNTPAHDYAVSCGAEECWVIGNGVLNGHAAWSGCVDYADYLKNGNRLPAGNFCDPPTQAACYQVGRLLRNPGRMNATARPHCPAFMDLEGMKHFICFPGYDLAVRKKYVRDWIQTLAWIRDGAGGDQELSIYGMWVYRDVHGDDDDAELIALLGQLNDQLTTACVTGYYWDWDVENRGAGIAVGELMKSERQIRRHVPTHANSKTILVNPYSQDYWPANDLPEAAALNMTAVPMESWQALVDRAVREKYVIVLWLGWSDLEPIRPHIAYLMQYGLAPRGDAAKWLAK